MATSPQQTTTTRNRPPVTSETQELLLCYCKKLITEVNRQDDMRPILLQRDLDYARELNRTTSHLRAQAANNSRNTTAIQDVTIPVVSPQVESALAYLSQLFLSSYPIFPVVSKAQLDDIALQLETLIGDQGIRFGYVPELIMALRDGLKYNILATEVDWDRLTVPSFSTEIVDNTPKATSIDTYYEGNRIKRIDPYNLILDPRVPISQVHMYGEFAGYTELWNKVRLQEFFLANSINTLNATLAYESRPQEVNTYHIPEVNPQTFSNSTVDPANWISWLGLETSSKIKYSGYYEITTMYVRIVPKEFKHSRSGIPTIFKLIICNQQHIIYLKEQSNAHRFLPMLCAQPIEDGLGYQTKSFSDNAAPLQRASSALYNSAIESQRRKVYDRLLYNPALINKSDIDNTSSVARIPVKSQAYGAPLANAVYQIPYRDEGVASILSFSKDIAAMADDATGSNRSARGQFQKGNKSRAEFTSIMDRSDSRMELMAQFLEHRFFQPLKEIIKLNILQYQLPTTLYNRNESTPVDINPAQLRQAAIEFRVADGVLPVNKMVNIDAFQGIMQMAMANPAIAQQYDIMGMMLHYLQLSGASWVKEFKLQQQPMAAAPQQTPAQ